VVSLVLGCLALACVIVLALIFALAPDRVGGAWLLLPFTGLLAGSIACFLGVIAWFDVRRGDTDRHLLAAQVGTITGGVAAGLVLLAVVVLIVFGVIFVVGWASSGMD